MQLLSICVIPLQAGAKHVYAIEASEMAEYARKLIAGNPLLGQRITVRYFFFPVFFCSLFISYWISQGNTYCINYLYIQVIKGRVEDVVLPEKADILISEPMGKFIFCLQSIIK